MRLRERIQTCSLAMRYVVSCYGQLFDDAVGQLVDDVAGRLMTRSAELSNANNLSFDNTTVTGYVHCTVR